MQQPRLACLNPRSLLALPCPAPQDAQCAQRDNGDLINAPGSRTHRVINDGGMLWCVPTAAAAALCNLAPAAQLGGDHQPAICSDRSRCMVPVVTMQSAAQSKRPQRANKPPTARPTACPTSQLSQTTATLPAPAGSRPSPSPRP